jgi:hypothetical protein
MPQQPSRLLQTQANSWRCAALCAIRRTAAWTENRHESFARLAAHRSIGLDGSDIGRRGIALVALIAFVPRSTLWPLWPLSACGTLAAGDTLYALGTLWAGGTLWPRIALGTGVSPTSSERKRNTNYQDGENFHNGPCAVCTLTQCRAASISASVAPLLRAHASAAGSVYFAT